jgi:hypothetical protein
MSVYGSIQSLFAHAARHSSSSSLDSLDLTRYSDEGEGRHDERVAVLEFELRKAHETIKSLRTSLTKASGLSSSGKHLQCIVRISRDHCTQIM